MSTPDDEEGPAEDRPMTLAEHLDELRKRVMWCILIAGVFCVACWMVEDALMGVAMAPANSVLRAMKSDGFISTQPGEKFFTAMKVDIVAGVFLSAPLILYVLWGFVARGLHAHEKRFVRIYAPFSYVLFLGGCAFFYFVIQPFTLDFLFNYGASEIVTPDGGVIPVDMRPAIAPVVSFFLSMTLITGLVFEMPLVMLFLQAIRLTTWRTFAKYRKHFFFGMVVLSALITPTGDALTLAIFMAPMLVLFEGGLLLCRIMAPKDI